MARWSRLTVISERGPGHRGEGRQPRPRPLRVQWCGSAFGCVGMGCSSGAAASPSEFSGSSFAGILYDWGRPRRSAAGLRGTLGALSSRTSLALS